MPTRKQRRRQAKERRHEYEYVYVDEQGNEVEVEPGDDVAAAPRGRKEPAKSSPGKKRSRTGREPTPPSWGRTVRRAAPWLVILWILVLFVFRGSSVTGRLLIAVVYSAAFLPFTYWIEKRTYERHLRRKEQGPPTKRQGASKS